MRQQIFYDLIFYDLIFKNLLNLDFHLCKKGVESKYIEDK